MRLIHPRVALAAALALACCSAYAQSSVQGDAVVFGRSVYNADGTARASSLFLVDPEGIAVRALTPRVDGVHDGGAEWSPSGRFAVFTRYRLGQDGAHLRIVPRSGATSRAITREPGQYSGAAWGPGVLIAFTVLKGSESCTAVIDWRGGHSRELLCPAARTGHPTDVGKATWSMDGRSLYVPASYLLGRIDPIWVSLVYRVDVATGAVTLLTRQEFFDSQDVAIAPGGDAALYSRSSLVRVRFDDDTQAALGSGSTPVYSRDGARVAFTRSQFTGPPEFISTEQLFVMDADGGNLRQLTDERVDNLSYTATQWSRDGSQLLVQRTLRPEGGGVAPTQMRIVDVASGEMRSLAEGYANDWFDR